MRGRSIIVMQLCWLVAVTLALPAAWCRAENPVKDAGKEVGRETGPAVRKAGRSMGDWFKDAGHSIKRFFTGG